MNRIETQAIKKILNKAYNGTDNPLRSILKELDKYYISTDRLSVFFIELGALEVLQCFNALGYEYALKNLLENNIETILDLAFDNPEFAATLHQIYYKTFSSGKAKQALCTAFYILNDVIRDNEIEGVLV